MDTPALGGGNDTVTATDNGHLAVFDTLSGGAGQDTLVFGGNQAITDLQFTGVSSFENVRVLNGAGGVALGANAAAAGVRNVSLENVATNLDLTGFNAAVAVTGSAAVDGITMSLADAGAKTFNLGGGQDTVQVNGNTAGTNVALAIGADATLAGTHTFDTNGVTFAINAGAFAVNDGVARGNFADVRLGTTGADTITVGGATAVYVTGGAGNDSITGSSAADVLIGGEGNDSLIGNAGNDTVLGGLGNDTITVTTGVVSVDGGNGDDRVVFSAGLVANTTTAANNDTLAGGEGRDTLVATSADLVAINNTVADAIQSISGFEVVEVSNVLDGNLIVARIQAGIDTVTLGRTGGDLATGGDDTVTGGAGSFTVNLGAGAANNTAGVLAGALVIQDTGTATTDVVTVNNTAVNTTTGLNIDVFGGQNLTSTGYELVNLSTGAIAGGAQQTIGTLTVTADAAAANTTLAVSGTNRVVITSATTNSTGLFTVDASGMTAQATGLTFRVNGTTSGTDGTQRITGSAGNDHIVVGNFAATIDGGAGNDSIVGGTAADSILGGVGDDTLVGGTGNDTLDGGEGADTISATGGNNVMIGGVGNDTITAGNGNDNIDAGAGDDRVVMAGNLTVADTVAGGEGTDTLVLAGGNALYSAAMGARTSGFETLEFTGTAAITQDLFNFSSNNTISRVAVTEVVANNVTITGAGDSLNALTLASAQNSGTVSLSRLVDGSANALTLALTGAAGTFAAVSLADEESLTINSAGTGAHTITTLTAGDLTSLTVTGAQNLTITNAISGASNLATVNLAGATGNVSINASASTVNLTLTGNGDAVGDTLVFTSGSGNDVLTAGLGVATINGGDGNDSITGSAGADSLSGGAGNDTIIGGAGEDIITGGAGVDVLTGGAGADNFVFAAGHSTLASMSTITDYRAAGGDNAGASDVITLDGVTGALGTTTTVVDRTAGNANLASALDAAAAANDIDNGVLLFIYNGDTYLYVESAGDGTQNTYASGDTVIKIVGTPFAAGTNIAGLGIDSL